MVFIIPVRLSQLILQQIIKTILFFFNLLIIYNVQKFFCIKNKNYKNITYIRYTLFSIVCRDKSFTQNKNVGKNNTEKN